MILIFAGYSTRQHLCVPVDWLTFLWLTIFSVRPSRESMFQNVVLSCVLYLAVAFITFLTVTQRPECSSSLPLAIVDFVQP